MNEKIEHIHLLAICGTAMGSLAAMLKSLGYKVTGSDMNVYPPMSTFLKDQGIEVYEGFSPSHLEPEPDLVIVGNAISRGNPEVETVLDRRIHYMSMPEALKTFFIQDKRSIVVSGTHGKTTTSSLIAWIFDSAEKSPGFLIGGIVQNFNKGFQVGNGETFIVEGDEYDSAFFDKGAKFFHYMPEVLVLNNIEFDHADIFDNLDQIKLAFRRLINLVPRNGLLLAGAEDENVKELMTKAFCSIETFGIENGFYWSARNIRYKPDQTRFDVFKENKHFASFTIPLSGNHNVRNALAAIGAAHFHKISPTEIQNAFTTYKNVKKRLELKAIIDDIIIYDDFAHHPTAVKTTLEGLKFQYPDRKIWAVYEPRTATAKRKIMEKIYTLSFDYADEVILAPVHLPQKVRDDERLSVENLVSRLKERQIKAHYLKSINEIVNYLIEYAKAHDLIVIMSNGAFGGIHDLLIEGLSNR